MKLKLPRIIVCVLVILHCSPLLVHGQLESMSWQDDFSDIALANITTQNQVPEGSATVILNTNGNAEISADNTTTAQLSSATDTLFTEYKLTFDGDGINDTGGPTVAYTSYDSFLSSPVQITRVEPDDDVDVTLYVRASNYAGDVADSGTYTATQTLTAHWRGE